MIPIKTHIPPNLSLESRQEQLAVSAVWAGDHGAYEYLDRNELLLVVELLRSDCERLRKELDDAKGIIR